ncbi:kinase-like domain-containing protein [Hypoxylon rubiginosum]|uniref:Kinase-like domain-containing protein n=1 Tax=Hypoxylon rubiginosum TaxID=110542 RepID=A0ACC0DJY5_9PEZI|nr:kinase-like domain-containing protein [Hypoxylon rubiginosum]
MSTVAMWWDPSRIEATVTRQFVCSHLLPEEIKRLDLPLGFGDGLTDGTYWEWIDEKAKRIFLILLDLGVPDQIFGLIDDSWDDNDLPIPPDQIERLALTATRDDKFDRRFYLRQYHYLLKFIEKGVHVVYEDPEVVPINVDKRPGLNLNSAVDRVELPNRPGDVFSRRRIPIGTGPGMLSCKDFLTETEKANNVEYDHLVSYFGSYYHNGQGYVLFTLPSDYSLKSLLVNMPGSLKTMAKQDRRQLFMNWIHCLVDTLCFLHSRGLSHGNIRPSTVLFNNNNHVFYSDITRLSAEAIASTADKAAFDKETYDYAAPEQWYRPSTSHSSLHRKSTLIAASSASASTSSDNSTFSISRGSSEAGTPASMLHTPTPSLDPRAVDVFSLGCVILELISLLMKRQTRNFASHRAAKHKLAGRGGAVLDSSFHKNIGQVESWMAGLAKDASKKDDQVFRGVAPMLQVVARMLSVLPHERPTAQEVERSTYKILTENCLIKEPHCVHQWGGWDFGLGNLHISRGGGGGGEGFNIATRRHSGSARPSSSARPMSHRPMSSGSIREEDIAGSSAAGLQGMQSIRSNKVRNWQARIYAGN